MSNPNPFILDVSEYKRDLDFVPAYLESHALYLSSMTGKDFDECLEYVKTQSRPGGKFELTNPKALIVNKNGNGDREVAETTLMGFINRVVKNKLTTSPSLSTYLPEVTIASAHAQYIEEGVINRSKTKKEQLRLEGLGTPEAVNLAKTRKGQQENFKLNNNSYSGAALSTATILFNKSTHPALTSTCRVATSLSNSNNEKFIMGNRHYYSMEITKGNILSICQLTDMELLNECMVAYNLHWPTVDEFVDTVHYSYKNYIHNPYFTEQIKKLGAGLSPIQRAAVVYVGDMYHLYQYNNTFVKTMLLELSKLGDPDDGVTEDEFNKLDGDIKLLSNFISFEQTRGRNHEKLKEESPEVFSFIYGTAKNVLLTLDKYKLLFKALFLTDNVPHAINNFPSIYRKAVPVSDTDSTMFTLQYWVKEIFGSVIFTPEALRLTFAMTFLISETVMHLLALQSVNMGVSDKRLRQLAMKNEYFFALLSLTNRSKHYYASQDGIEGLMLAKARLEIKGVGLRSSKTPANIAKKSRQLIESIINRVKAGKSINVRAILKDVADMERKIVSSIKSGSAEFLLTGTVKRMEAYKSKDNATFAKHGFWKEVFSPTYGELPEPPYTFFKLKVTTTNRTRFNEWVETIEDKALAARLMNWHSNGRAAGINIHHIPFSVVENMGVPLILAEIADYRTTVFQTMETFYLILEALGFYFDDKDTVRLISDYY